MLRLKTRFLLHCRLSAMAVLLCLTFPSSSSATTCSADLRCWPGYAEASERNSPKFRDLNDGITAYVNYCATTQEHPYAHFIWNSPVVGFSKDCRRLFTGQYGANGKAGDWAYYRPNGTPMATAHFTNGTQIWRQWISTLGQNIRFDTDIESPSLFKGVPTSVSINADTMKGPLPYPRDGVRAKFDWLCAGPVELTWDFRVLVRAFEHNSLSVQFSRADSKSALYISAPVKGDENGSVDLYYASVHSGTCRGTEAQIPCDVHVIARRKTAPVRDGLILISRATDSDGAISQRLADAAASSVKSGTVWCRWKISHPDE